MTTDTKEKNANHAATAPAFLSVWDLHAYYGESYIVQGVSFNVHEGEILALLGRNGAGKTSTLRAIARLGDPEARKGEIWLDHQPLHLLDEPYEGLAPVIVDEIEKTLALIKEQGITTILVEQNALRALKLADRAVILDTGGIVFDGTADEVLNNDQLRAEYLAI